jgi:HAD superfamily hydrolase (TIGR01490 family)
MVGYKSDSPADGPLVFVDIDNTLLSGAVVFLFALEARRQKMLTLSDVIPAIFEQRHFRRQGESDLRIAGIQERALSLIRGHSDEEFTRVAEATWSRRITKRLFPEVVELLDAHTARGDRVFVLSASPQRLVDVIARELGLAGGMGTRLEMRNGVFTGELEGTLLRGPEKLVAATKRANELGEPLEQASAYADSMADLPLLEAVGHPCAVNPDQALHREAVRRGWPIVWPRATHRYRRLRT